MKLGLVRHFKVIVNEKAFLNSDEFADAMKRYDIANVQNNGLQINSDDWDICYCSSLPRALTTAETIYNKKIVKTDLAVEVPISPVFKTKLKFPILFWHIIARIAWFFNHKSQREGINETRKRVAKFYNLIKNSGYKRILIVAHGYFLHNFIQEMKKKGFAGEVEVNVKNAKLYTLED